MVISVVEKIMFTWLRDTRQSFILAYRH
uniref:Uncharacterized protein n=1 Tax=Anguilla anguilla TaxID=7936 RepID=A0A0E9V2H1_ANGAN